MRLSLILLLLVSNIVVAQVNMTLGLRAYYPFNGNANDASGNNNNPTFNNAILAADRFGNPNSAYQFNGTSNYIQIPNSASLNMTNQISLCAWVKVSGFYAGPCHGNRIIMKGNTDTPTGSYNLGFNDGPFTNYQNCVNPIPDIAHENFQCSSVSTPPPGFAPYIQTGQWYSVVFTCDGTTSKLYVDCVLKATTNAVGAPYGNVADLFLGKLNNASFPYWFNGVMDEVRIYNRALTTDEVKYYGGCPVPTGTNISGIINSYTPVISFGQCKNTVDVLDASTFNTGDTVLLIQMKGAVIDSTNTAAFGTITDLKNAGNYEFNYVKSKTGNTIELKNNLTRNYDLPNGKVQLIRVPYYTRAIVTSTLSCLPWDGNKGGILAFNVQDSLNMNEDIDVSGKGFRGGNDPATNPPGYSCYQNQFYYPVNPDIASEKGEGIASISAAKSYGKGALGSGGGGGNSHNSGGGGGGNAGAGGYGGYNFEGSPCNGTVPFDNRGWGGKVLTYSNAANRLFMGGGGGGGHSNNPENFQAIGGNGAGIIIITADKLVANGHKIIANGNAGTPCGSTGTGCHEGMGGGGAAGTIALQIATYTDNVQIETIGGKGANMIAAGFGRVGPGGGGGGGAIWFSNASLPGGVTPAVTGGLNGVATDYSNDPWGTTPGQTGTSLFNLQLPIDNVLFKANIDSVRIHEASTGCFSFDFNGFGYTNTSPISTWEWFFGDGGTANTQNTSHTYSTSGTYQVKLVVTDINGCKDSIIKPVTTTTLDFDFNYQINICNPLTVQFHGLGSANQNPYWDFGDAQTTLGNLNPIHTYAAQGAFVVKYSVSNGTCIDTITKTIPVSVIQDNIVLTRDTTICAGTTKQLLTTPSLGFCWTPSTYLNNPNLPNPITSTPQTMTYYFIAEVQGNNLIVNGDFSAGNTGFTSAYVYATPNVTEGQYYVGTNPQAWNSSVSPCPDHTSGTGNMMMINGAPTPDVKVWSETVTVTPNTNYAFSTWIQSIFNQNPAKLQFSINGHDLGSPITASLPTCNWKQFYTTWNSGNSTSATISIVNKNTIVLGNDFALDDISFSPVLIKIDSVKITVDTPHVDAVPTTQICPGESVQLNATGALTYSWSPATGLNNANIANPLATPAVNTQYIVTGINANGCTAKDTIDITMKSKPVITKSTDPTICIGSSTQLMAGGGTIYSWTPSATLNNSSSPTPIATPPATTTYYVTVTGSNSCTNIDSVKVTVKAIPVFSIDPPNSICLNKSIQLNAAGGDVYDWQPASTLNNSAIHNPVATPLATTPYTVLITDTTCHLSANLSVIITVKPLPDITASKSNDIDCANVQSQLDASGATTYEWTPVGTLDNAGIHNPVATPKATTIYLVKGTDAVTGCDNLASITVNVTNAGFSVFAMPNAFTPNGDGLNDCYGIKYWGTIEDLDFNIYNRWGERVFHTNNPNQCWDGTYKGKKQDPNVFVYWIRCKTSCTGSVFRKGTFVLIR